MKSWNPRIFYRSNSNHKLDIYCINKPNTLNCSHNSCKIEFPTFLLLLLGVTYRCYGNYLPKFARFSVTYTKTS